MPNDPRTSEEIMNDSRRRFIQMLIALGVSAAAAARAADQIPLAPPGEQPPNLDVPQPVSRKAGWAIVGLGQLALGEIMPAFADCKLSKPTALVSGHRQKAEQVAEVYGVPQEHLYNYENYDALAANDDVDVIYIVLPNSMHAEFTNRGLRAGKHVLCEKPMAGSTSECQQMIRTAEETGKKLMIAYRLHYEPFNRKVMELCEAKTYGEIKTFSSSNCQSVQAPNIRLSSKLAGGPVGDVGVYSINAARYCIGSEPIEVMATAHQPRDDPRFREVPESVAFILKYPQGELAHCDCSFGTAESRRFRVHCTDGWIELDPAFGYHGLELRVNDGKREQQWALGQVNHFASEMDHFSDCVLHDKQNRTPGQMGLADQRIIDAIAKSIATGQPVPIGAR